MFFFYRRNKKLSQYTVLLINTVQFQNENRIFSTVHWASSIAITYNMQYHQFFMLRQNDKIVVSVSFQIFLSFDFSAFSPFFALLSVLVTELDELDTFNCSWRSKPVVEKYICSLFFVLSSRFRLQFCNILQRIMVLCHTPNTVT